MVVTHVMIDTATRTEGPVETACRLLCRLALIATVLIIDVELVTRNFFGFSWYLSDEYGGYLLVALTFLSLPVCVVHRSFHRVIFLLRRIPPRPRIALLVAFDLAAFGFAVAVLWQVATLVLDSWRLGITAPTLLETPLWIPQLAMPLGMAALCCTLLRAALGHVRTFIEMRSR